MRTFEYDLSHQELLSRYTNALRTITIDHSGLETASIGESFTEEYIMYLYGVLLARLDGVYPPVKSGALVHPQPETFFTYEKKLESGKACVIDRVWYLPGAIAANKKGPWMITLKESGDKRFNFADFVIVAQMTTVVEK